MGDVAVVVPAVGGSGVGPADVVAYEALHAGAAWFDRRARVRTDVRGPLAAETISGLVTNDIKSLAPGHGHYAAALTPKGKIIADVRVFAYAGGCLVDTSPQAGDGWLQLLRKYVNPRVAPYTNVSTTVVDIGVFGARAMHLLGAALELPREALAGLAPYGHLRIPDRVVWSGGGGGDGIGGVVARVPDLGIDGFDILIPAAGWDAAVRRLTAVGVVAATADVWTVARVEAGRPEWGVEIDDRTIPQEANFDELGAISYTKGCYTGQETVARIHFRGHVNRHLRGIEFAGPVIPPALALVVDEGDKPLGEIRSAVHSPRHGGIALAMLRREVSIGAHVTARWQVSEDRAQGETGGTVTDLPFPSPH
jgi:folate-binding protein YgfZ